MLLHLVKPLPTIIKIYISVRACFPAHLQPLLFSLYLAIVSCPMFHQLYTRNVNDEKNCFPGLFKNNTKRFQCCSNVIAAGISAIVNALKNLVRHSSVKWQVMLPAQTGLEAGWHISGTSLLMTANPAAGSSWKLQGTWWQQQSTCSWPIEILFTL